MANVMEIRVPDIGDFEGIPVIEVLVSVGDTVEAEQSLVTLESDKATMEVPAPEAGIIMSVEVALDDTVSEGDLVATLEVVSADDGAQERTAEPKEALPDVTSVEEDFQPADGASSANEPAKEAAAAVTRSLEVMVPDIGDFEGVPVIEVLVSAGDVVDAEQSLVTLESDKATMEVPAPQAGIVERVAVTVDDAVSQGDLVAVLTVSESAPAPSGNEKPAEASNSNEAPAAKPVAESTPAPAAKAESAGKRQSPPVPMGAGNLLPDQVPYASPAIRAFARELGVDLSRITGTGRKGRILRADVTGFVKAVMRDGARPVATPGFEVAPPPKVDFSKFGDTETVELSRIKRISGKNLHRNWVTIPHVTHHDLADTTALEAFRQEHKGKAKAEGYSLTPLAFLMKSVVAALQQFPNVNSSLDASGENLVLKKYFNLGIAVDTPDGLVVPVIRNCDEKSVTELAKELGEVSQRARDGKLKPADWQGASFSISSLGGIGGTAFTPIVNAPEVAILGVSRSRMEPVWDGEDFKPKLMLPLSLSYDHRVIDGAQAARFTRALAEHIEDTDNLVL